MSEVTKLCSGSRPKSVRLVILLAAVFLAPTLITPLRFDNAIFQSLALDLYRFGKWPYLGTWVHDVPGMIFIHYAAITIFGTTDLGLRLFDYVIEIAFAGFFCSFLTRWLRPQTAALTAILFVLYYVAGGVYMYVQRDVYVVMLVMISISLLLKSEGIRASRYLFIGVAGVLVGFAILIRSTSLPYLVVLALYPLLGQRERGLAPVKRVACFILAGLAPIGLVLLYYSQFPQGLNSFYIATIRWNLDLYTKFSIPYEVLGKELARMGLTVPFAVYALVGSSGRNRLMGELPKRERLLYQGLLIVSLATILIQHKFFRYHFAPFFLLIAPLTAIGIERFIARMKGDVSRQYTLLAIVYMCTLFSYNPRAPLAFALALVEHKNAAQATYMSEYPDTLDGAIPERRTISYLQMPENARGPIEICSYQPYLRLHINRECVGPYNVLDAMGCRTDADSTDPPRYTNYQISWQNSYLHLLIAKRPTFIIIDRQSSWYYLRDPYKSLLRNIQGFDSLLTASYHYDTTFGSFQIFRRNS